MADVIVSFLVKKVGDQLIEEAKFLKGVTNEVHSLETELKQLQQFLSKADRNCDKEQDVNEWLRKLRDAAYDGEDIIDEFILRCERRRCQRLRIKRWVLFLHDMPARRRVGKSIVGVNERLNAIFACKDRYGIEVNLPPALTQALEDRKERDSHPQMDVVIVGFKDQEKRLVQRLTGQIDELRVVSIVGMGGLGKTTLAKKVYANRDVQMKFECIVWVSVAQNCQVNQLLQELINKIKVWVSSITQHRKGDELLQELIKKTVGDSKELANLDTVELKNVLKACLNDEQILKEKRFLIIMDDVWEHRLWTRIKPAFRDIQNGSRILFTTRSYDVAKVANPIQDPFELNLLSEEESWELFNWKVFSSKDGCPPDLVKKGKKLVEKCKRLPLAIIILGGLLWSKSKSVMVWDKVLTKLDWRSDPNTEDWREVLALSYHDMPSYLKPCFLYLGLFPEDTEIWSNKLKMLWIAEGFTEVYKNKNEMMSPEDIAEEYLEELYQRSLIQVVSKKSYGGSRTCGIKSFRIHDLLRDFAIARAEEFEFLTVHGIMESNSPPKARRRLAIQGHVDEKLCNQTWLDLKGSSPKLRSLLCFKQRQISSWPLKGPSQSVIPIVDGLKLLRVIDLKDVKLERLPEEIGTLTHLRFLGLNNTGLERLQESVGDLFNLLTLDIRWNRKLTVPPSVWKMKKLRHLYLDRYTDPPQQIDSLPNIQILNGIPAGDWIANSLVKLTSLNRLTIREISLNHGTALASALPQLQCLNYLALIVIMNEVGMFGEWASFIPTKLPFKDLNRLFLLTLFGRLERLPNVNEFPTQLMKLTLNLSMLDQDPMPVLGQLQSLESLKLLEGSYTGRQMVCPPSSFPKLKFFKLQSPLLLWEWKLEFRAMISLKRLVIHHCILLKMLPEGLKHTSDLQELELVDMPSRFLYRVRENGGEDLHKIHRSTPISLIIQQLVGAEDGSGSGGGADEERVGDQLIEEAKFLKGVTNQVCSLQTELKQLQSFLNKADLNRDKDEQDVKEWPRQLRDAAYDGEDIIDEFILRCERRRRQRVRMKRWVLFLHDMPARRRVGKSIVGVNERLNAIFACKDRYGIEVNLPPALTQALEDRKERDSHPQMDVVIVGFEDQEKRLVQRLTVVKRMTYYELRVVSIVGMGGLGKTTLAKKVYANRDVQMKFECIVWVSVAQYYEVKQLLRELINKIKVWVSSNTQHRQGDDLFQELIKKTVGDSKDPANLATAELKNVLNACLNDEQILKEKRFLIIMDDVWEHDLWTRIKPAFRDIQNGSRILFTTRSYDVAKVANPSQDPFELNLLSEEESWELFIWKVFSSKDGCPPDLVKKGKELVEKCKRLPLAIIILGGLLWSKSKSVMVWDKVLTKLDWRSDPNTEDWREVLALSYHDMPSYLKPCFLYLGLFPEDEEIWSSKLKMLWIAEGFTEIYKNKNKMMSPEDIAEDYWRSSVRGA
ncbi:putative disease resistance protein [Acorus calamus]|uniref:Disease resistance protein n=1 Tax=Acorus calamus TaxID=4465 RepID=A0AAV9CUJ8_ACOCL|nr:putative disease resistance protein [Acorus calamus]